MSALMWTPITTSAKTIERFGNDLDDLEGEPLHRVERVAQQQLVPGEHEDGERGPEQRANTRDIERGEDEREPYRRADRA